MTLRDATCELCRTQGGELIVQGDRLRVVHVPDPDHPALYRVIWHEHVREWTDLDHADRSHVLDAVAAVELALRRALAPTKVNLASLGNQVAHLHWHVIARFDWDSHFPNPVWAPRLRPGDASCMAAVQAQLPAVDAAIRDALGRDLPATPDAWPVPPT